MIVKIACNVTNPYNSIGLSKICQVIAHIAPIKFGTIAKPNQKKYLYVSKLLSLLTINIVKTHSNTLEICIIHVPIDNSCKIFKLSFLKYLILL